MPLLASPRTWSAIVCDYCQRVETPGGDWLDLHPDQRPGDHLISPDICPECCDHYAAFLLDPTTSGEGHEIPMPPFRQRPSA